MTDPRRVGLSPGELIACEADEAARAAAARSGVEIRVLDDLDDLRAVYGLYNTIWRPDPTNPPVTTEMLRALTKAGNYVSGAFDTAGAAGGPDTASLVGACVGFFASPADAGMHSHIAGVAAGTRGRAIGFALKLHQRAWALANGVRHISWTFDPLVRRNAYFNFVKLRGDATEYITNFYGSVHDDINGSDDTDRIVVGWRLDSAEVAAACRGEAAATPRLGDYEIGLDITADGHPVPIDTAAAAVRFAVPPDIEQLRRTDPELAGRWRAAMREALRPLLADGGHLVGFHRDGWYLAHRLPHLVD